MKRLTKAELTSDNDDHDHSQYESGDWIECWNCGGNAYVDHDCGEDTCCCLYPDDNVVCDICNGDGGWINEGSTENARCSGLRDSAN